LIKRTKYDQEAGMSKIYADAGRSRGNHRESRVVSIETAPIRGPAEISARRAAAVGDESVVSPWPGGGTQGDVCAWLASAAIARTSSGIIGVEIVLTLRQGCDDYR
jgi:hypothetical protein